jgi:O-methyltransferase
VRTHTLVDTYRCYTLWTLARQAARRGLELAGDAEPPSILEVGVWQGGTSAVLAAAVSKETKAAGEAAAVGRLVLADTFTGVVKAGSHDPYYKGGEHANTSEELVRGVVAPYFSGEIEVLSGVFPEDTGDRISSDRFSLVHIDVDVYQSARDAYEWALPRTVPGGAIVFDDYAFYGCEGVTHFVNEIFYEAGHTVVHSLSGQAILVVHG